MKSQDYEIRSKGAGKGVLLGLLVSLFAILPMYFYVTFSSFLFIVTAQFFTSVILPLIFSVVFILQLRKSRGGYWSFKEAVSGIFIMVVIAFTLFSVVGYAFERFVDPNLREHFIRNLTNASIEYFEKVGANDAFIDEQIEKIDRQLENTDEPTILNLLNGWVFSVIILFVVSLVFAAIFKRDRPVFNQEAEREEL